MGIEQIQLTTKKMLVAFDPSKPESLATDFLVPVLESEKLVLFGTKTKKGAAHGMVVYIGRSVSVNDIFAKLVDTGRKMPSVSEALKMITEYIEQLAKLRIGQVVQIEPNGPAINLLAVTIVKSPRNRKPLP